jgi:broad specificity phosphatase PhoE
MDTRLLLISHASTAAMRAGRFPADDPLDARGLAEAGAAHARLSILWRGRRLADLAVEAPQELAAWTHDPDAAAHGGESFTQLVKRVGQWLDALDNALSEEPRNAQNIVAITHAPVIRAVVVHALGAPPAVFPRIEIAPLAMVELRRSRRGWAWWPASQ